MISTYPDEFLAVSEVNESFEPDTICRIGTKLKSPTIGILDVSARSSYDRFSYWLSFEHCHLWLNRNVFVFLFF